MKTLGERATWIAVGVVAVIVGGACGLGRTQEGGGVTTSGSPAASPVILATPQEAAEHLYDAWEAGDEATALLGASAAAVDALFAETWAADTYFFGGCADVVAPTQCQYNTATGAVLMDIAGNATAGFTVSAVSFGSAG